jgi:hypothetical protein
MNNWCICWVSRIFLLWILIFKWLTARRLYKSFGVTGIMNNVTGKIKLNTEAMHLFVSIFARTGNLSTLPNFKRILKSLDCGLLCA